MLRPDSLARAVEQLRQATAAGHSVLVRGAGTATDWGAPVAADVHFDTGGLSRLLRHQATDLTVAVQAGMPLRALQAELAGHRQRVAFDAARVAAGATVGGLIATADAGPSVLRYGTLRDLVIGATLLLADGTLARTGGEVIKNVAGYDLAKLVHGSLGTLAVIVEVILRLHPLPAATATLRVPCDAAEAYALGGELLRRALEPTALEWCDGLLLARFEGTGPGLADTARQARRLAGADADWWETTDDWSGTSTPDWQRVADTTLGAPGDTVLRVGTRPSLLPWLVERVRALAAGYGVTAAVRGSLGAGVHDVRIRAGAPDPAGFLTELRADIHRQGGTSTVIRWGDGLAATLPAWPEPPPAQPLLKAVKQAFDPAGRLGPGRFAPWW